MPGRLRGRKNPAVPPTYEEAAAAGLAIKKGYPIVEVAVYDTVKSERKMIELPA